jgi:hypothetical protein
MLILEGLFKMDRQSAFTCPDGFGKRQKDASYLRGRVAFILGLVLDRVTIQPIIG